MFKSNSDGKAQFDRAGVMSLGVQIAIIIATVVAVYLTAISDLKVQLETMTGQIEMLKYQVGELQESIDALEETSHELQVDMLTHIASHTGG